MVDLLFDDPPITHIRVGLFDKSAVSDASLGLAAIEVYQPDGDAAFVVRVAVYVGTHVEPLERARSAADEAHVEILVPQRSDLVVDDDLHDRIARAGRAGRAVALVQPGAEDGVLVELGGDQGVDLVDVLEGAVAEEHAEVARGGEAEGAMEAAQHGHEAPGARGEAEVGQEDDQPADGEHALGHAQPGAGDAGGAEGEVQRAHDADGVFDAEAGALQQVVQVVAVGAEGRLAHPHAAEHDAEGVDQRQREDPQRHDRRHQRIRPLGDGDEQPAQQQAERHAAVVAHEDAGAELVAEAQVEPQEAEHAAEQAEREQEGGAVAAQAGDQGDEDEGAGSDGAREAIDAVDHVERVDAADGAEDGEGHGCGEAHGDRADEEGVADVGEHHPAAVDHEQREPGLDDEADARRELPAVVGQADAEHDHAAHQQG